VNERAPIVILGAGPAGLGAALQFARRRYDTVVIERSDSVGGNAGSFELDGQRVDYGSHRLHPSCAPEILADIQSMLGPDLLERPRHGRIQLRGRWVHFPLQPVDLALSLPPAFLLGVMRDAVTKASRRNGADSFAAVLEHGLGRTICRDFYFPYAQKIWGVPPSQLDAEQARRRVSAGSLAKMVRKALNSVPGLQMKAGRRFFYPRHGYGQISEAYYREACSAGATVRLRTTLVKVEVDAGRAIAIRVRDEAGETRLPASHILSTIPLPLLVRAVTPPAPPEVLASAAALKYRAMILIYMVLETDRFTEYDAHYFPEPGVAITRLSEPKNYGLAGVPGVTVLCAELPCSTEDQIWKASDEELGVLVREALEAAGLPVRVPVRRVATRRLPQAYPIYARDYRQDFTRLDAWVRGIDRLLTFGRQGLFAHDNTHHALAMAYAASDSIDFDGNLDRQRWETHRRAFLEFVVED
jgi:protoporphyrinogen oxidase